MAWQTELWLQVHVLGDHSNSCTDLSGSQAIGLATKLCDQDAKLR